MQDIMTAIIHNLNLLNKQYTEVERELDYLYLEGDEEYILDEMDAIETELVKASFVNCTPHFITIEGVGELPPSGILPRATQVYCSVFAIRGLRIRHKVYGAGGVSGLPDPVEGLTFLVSGEVREALSARPSRLRRPDVYAPDTGFDAIRNEKGHIVAVRGLVQ